MKPSRSTHLFAAFYRGYLKRIQRYRARLNQIYLIVICVFVIFLCVYTFTDIFKRVKLPSVSDAPGTDITDAEKSINVGLIVGLSFLALLLLALLLGGVVYLKRKIKGMENNVEKSKTPEATSELISGVQNLQADLQQQTLTTNFEKKLAFDGFVIDQLQHMGILEKVGEDLKPNLNNFLEIQRKNPGIDWIKYLLNFDALLGKNLQLADLDQRIIKAVQETKDKNDLILMERIKLDALLPRFNTLNLEDLKVRSNGEKIEILFGEKVQKFEGDDKVQTLQKLAVVSAVGTLSSLGVQQIKNFGQYITNNDRKKRRFVRTFVAAQTLSMLIALGVNNFGIGVQDLEISPIPNTTITELQLLHVQGAIVQYEQTQEISQIMETREISQMSLIFKKQLDEEEQKYNKISLVQEKGFYFFLRQLLLNLKKIEEAGKDISKKELTKMQRLKEKGMLYTLVYEMFAVDSLRDYISTFNDFTADVVGKVEVPDTV